MNDLLNPAALGLKYRALPNLISQQVPLRSIDTITTDVLAWLKSSIPWQVSYRGREQRGGTVLKYGLLDLAFVVEGFTWADQDTASVALLDDLGFVPDRSEVSERDTDPRSVTSLVRDMDDGRAYLLLFLEEHRAPGYDRDYHMKLRALQEAGPQAPEHELTDRLIAQHFPNEFAVTDACITNARFAWMHKHFYM